VTLAESRFEQHRDGAALRVVIRRPDSGEEFTLYTVSEPAPPGYGARSDPDFYLDSWGTPDTEDLAWAADSRHLAFVIKTSPELASEGIEGDHTYRWTVFVADTETREVEQVADLGTCHGTFEGGNSASCRRMQPTVAWTPDSQSFSVLNDSTLTRYDLTGTELESQPFTEQGPVVWLESR
jgi:hypothetical protein